MRMCNICAVVQTAFEATHRGQAGLQGNNLLIGDDGALRF